MKRPAVIVVLLALLLGVAAPAVAQDASPVASPDAGPSLLADLGFDELAVTGTDAGLEVATEVAAGRYRLVFDNQSSLLAYVELYKVPESMTPEELLAAFEASQDSDEPPTFFYDLVIGGGANAEPGGTADVIVDLDAGTWLFNYFAFDEETEEDINIPTTVTVSGVAPAPAEITADVTVEMFEMDFTITGDTPAGPHVWEVTNSGEQPHFLLISRYPEPFTEADVMALLESLFAPPATPGAGASPVASPEAGLDFALVEDIFESGLLSTGQTNWVEIDLEPGYYVALCFIPDADSGVPHSGLGMIETFEVTE